MYPVEILHLTQNFYTTSGCDGCDKYVVSLDVFFALCVPFCFVLKWSISQYFTVFQSNTEFLRVFLAHSNRCKYTCENITVDWKCPIIPVTRLRAASKLPKGIVLFVLTAHSPLLLLTSCILFLYKLTCQLASLIIVLLHPVLIWGIIKVLIAKRTENPTFCDWNVVQALIEATPHICHRHHRRCLCKFFLSGVKFSWKWSMYFTNVV